MSFAARRTGSGVLVLLLFVVFGPGVGRPVQAQVEGKTSEAVFPEELPLIDTDTLLYVENRGLDRIFFTLSSHDFRLVTDASEIARSANAFLIPSEGTLTIHVGALIEPGGDNYVRLASQGPAGADADVVIAPVFVRGQSEVAYKIDSLEPLPSVTLLANHPNPFREQTTLRYTVPDWRPNGVEVVIAIYDVLGRRQAVFDEGRRFPGTFERTWQAASTLASGMYVARLTANGRPEATVSMIRVR
jgi:hypothetical protein